MATINFKGNTAAQDMVRIIMSDKGLLEKEAILFSVNQDIHQRILNAGYASIAFDLWGHDDPSRKRKPLKEKQIEIEFDELSQRLIEDVMKKEKVEFDTAISYFLLFTMDALGYHI
jgi:hypothetical protein